jgi:hypothetical protein
MRPGVLEEKVIPFYTDRLVLCNSVLGVGLLAALLSLLYWAIGSDQSSDQVPVQQKTGWLAEPLDADLILDTFADKNFGAGGSESLRSVSVGGEISIGGEAKPFHMLKKRPELALLRIELMDNAVATYGVNPGTVWLRVSVGQQEDDISELEGEEAESIRSIGRFLTPLADLAALAKPRGARVISLSVSEESDQELLQIEFKGVDEGTRHISYLTKDTLREIRRLDYVEGNEPKQSVFSDFRAVSGIWFPHLTEVFSGGELIQEISIEKLQVNPGVISSVFELPSDLGNP